MISAIFIDGPLAGETMGLSGPIPILKIPLPPRKTIFGCNPDLKEAPYSSLSVFEYYLAAKGSKVAIYSKNNSDETIIRALREWIITDLSDTDRIINYCRDKIAYQ